MKSREEHVIVSHYLVALIMWLLTLKETNKTLSLLYSEAYLRKHKNICDVNPTLKSPGVRKKIAREKKIENPKLKAFFFFLLISPLFYT